MRSSLNHDHDLEGKFSYTFFITSWSWSGWKGFQICSSLNHDHDFEGKVSISVLH